MHEGLWDVFDTKTLVTYSIVTGSGSHPHVT
jgi:hypothetical protein